MARRKLEIRDVDRGWKKLLREMRRAGKSFVKVGVLDERAHRTGEDTSITNTDLALIHEFGAGNVPERSFLRSTFDAQRGKYEQRVRTYARAMVDGKMDEMRALNLLGLEHVADIKRTIADGIPPPNAPATIARKGSSTPLVDTGQLLNSVTYAVVKGDPDANAKGGE
jgi:hypothetical protein